MENFREIPGFNGRYLINIEGDVKDLEPKKSDDQHWTTPIEFRILKNSNGSVTLEKNGKYYGKKVLLLLKEIFKDMLLMSEEEIETLKKKAKTQDSITYSIEDFNKIIYPNKLVKLYDKTYNKSYHPDPKDRRSNLWKKPNVVPMTNGKILIKKGHTYFGCGLTNLIYIKDMIPYNGKPTAESLSKEYMNEDKERKYVTELW